MTKLCPSSSLKCQEPPFCALEKDEHISGSSQSSCDPEVPERFSGPLPPLQDEKRTYASNHEI